MSPALRLRRLALPGTVLMVAAGAPLLTVTPAGGQTLEEVDSLVRVGRAEEARSVLSRWWEASGDGAGRGDAQRALWLRGVLTVDPEQAKLDFQRLTVEYPGGAFTDDAVLRLADLAGATGELAEAARWYRSLARDYPGSPARLEARSWLERNAEAVAAAEGAAFATDPADAADPAELPPGREPVSADEPVEDSASASGPFTVQLGAFLEEARARQLAERLREGGMEPRLVRVRGSGLLRVRVGRFDDAGPATRLYDRLVAMGYEAVVAADAEREEEAR